VNAQAVEAIILVVALVLAAMSAAAETALTALSSATLRSLQERGGVGKIIAYLRQDPNRFLATILIISSSSLIIASSMATLLCTHYLPEPWSVLAATIGFSLIVLIFAELTPKNIAVRQSRRVSALVARPVRVFSIILAPAIWLSGGIVSMLMRLLGQGAGSQTVHIVTEDELRQSLAIAEAGNEISEEETDRIEGVLDLDKITAGEVMKPRVDIIAVPVDMPLMDALDVVIREGHSRIPVYEETIDKIVGILYDKDLLKYVRENELEVSLRDVAREALFVPESKRADVLLRDFQKEKVHMAIVFDEYGGTAGLVTIEDLLEEIVGEIQDEYDEEEEPWHKWNDEEWTFDAMVRIDEVNEEMGLDLEAENGIETLGGFVYERLGEAPEPGALVHADHVRLEVEEVDGRRIKKVRITRLETSETETSPTPGD
jgi:CBS domain containing-hemolysin-like protein